MDKFEELCKQFEELTLDEHKGYLMEQSRKLLPVFGTAFKDAVAALTAYTAFILGAVAADGKFTGTEYELVSPMLSVFLGRTLSFEECMTIAEQAGATTEQHRQFLDSLVDMFGEVDQDIKSDLVIVALIICAVDGKVSDDEKKWIATLIE